ncbi:MAG: hypothetical protein KF713_12340 [Turneriella sp.]|nr:hypothetical protein [Turneriella sp.]
MSRMQRWNRFLTLPFARRHLVFAGIVTATLMMACNNYSLLEKLESPGGSSSGPIKLSFFVHEVVTVGDMSNLVNGGCSGNGIQRADCACQDKAAGANLLKSTGSKYIAWLSDATNDMTCRIQDRYAQLACTPPSTAIEWYTTTGQLVASSYAQLFSGALSAPVSYSASGTSIPGGTNVWTGTTIIGNNNGGTPAMNCSNWTVNVSQTGLGGTTGSATTTWTNSGSPSCSSSAYVLCIGIK